TGMVGREHQEEQTKMAEGAYIPEVLAILLPDGWHEGERGTGRFVKYRLLDNQGPVQDGYAFTERARAGTNLCVRADAILAVRYELPARNREATSARLPL